MAACTVTRAQYRLFELHLEEAHKSDFDRTAPDDDCPVIETNFFDGFCYALWLGDRYLLPSDTQWEGAARGGKDGPQDVIGIPPYDDSFTTGQVNFAGNHPLSGEKPEYLHRTLPVRWDAYQPNVYGIWQAHGNVWEWCLSQYYGEP